MRSKTYIRLFLLVLVTAASLVLFSYSRKKVSSENERSSECGGNKSCEKRAQSEFILWESLTRNLLSARG
jgi:cell division protein FtsL